MCEGPLLVTLTPSSSERPTWPCLSKPPHRSTTYPLPPHYLPPLPTYQSRRKLPTFVFSSLCDPQLLSQVSPVRLRVRGPGARKASNLHRNPRDRSLILTNLYNQVILRVFSYLCGAYETLHREELEVDFGRRKA